MLGRNKGYLNSSHDFCQEETEDILIVVFVLGLVVTEDI